MDLTFVPASRRIFRTNVESKTVRESYICECLFGSNVRSGVRCQQRRPLEPGHSYLRFLLTDPKFEGAAKSSELRIRNTSVDRFTLPERSADSSDDTELGRLRVKRPEDDLCSIFFGERKEERHVASRRNLLSYLPDTMVVGT